MLRVIFDTNIYCFLIKEKDIDELERKIKEDKEFIIYGYKPIRNEIRSIPKTTKSSRKARNLILSLYDKMVGKHFFEHSIEITSLAKKYYDYYRNFGGVYNWDTSIRIDFMIVACASFHGLDVIYSGDNKTLAGKQAIKAYNHINIRESLRTPNFLKYEDLLMKFRN